ncbi:MAG TPA: tetratricopeptide repeat protein [Croceibacterium sp.]|nr:tetratricopeptide repeat protein [Croceibacterium sp.]
MNRIANSNRVFGPRLVWAATTAMSAALLTGCTTNVAAPATVSASRAEAALARGKSEQAITHAEAAVLADPRNAAYRATLGSAYLDAGRFASAATSFDDAMQLGDHSPRTALSLALSLMGAGKHAEAAALLNDREGDIATADLGLALALAGQPERGIHVMGNAIRGGENTAKMRQNLAYAYALAGRWREARLMAEQDVPADKVSDRIQEWALMAQPQAWQHRVAALLSVPVGAADAGQPVELALANNPSIDQLGAEATGFAAADSAAELPPLAEIAAPAQPAELPPLEPVAAPAYAAPATERASNFQTAFATPAPAAPSLAQVSQDAARFVQSPVVQALPARRAVVAAPAPSAGQAADGTHLVQLGSFASEQGAKRAWGIYVSRYPELAGHQMVISEAVVRGKRYWRVSAAGFGRSTSSAMCGLVKARGEGCFAYAEGRPLPGAVDTGVRLARRD